ncbi:Flp1 family type IVb pilin [Paenibacillaceae bacterium WGS1546]|uniref:Flp1 family type IVb pilin n=1 Tax=Cohnella sp. WGS1546 TaxID=3366810 RepID=UPI00372D1004
MLGLYVRGVNALRALRDDEEGIGTLELVLIVAVLIALVLVFRKEIIEFLESLMTRVESKSEDVFK